MALDYVNLRNTLDAANTTALKSGFRTAYSTAIGNDAYSSLQSALKDYLNVAIAKPGYAAYSSSVISSKKKAYESAVDSYIGGLTDINKYITTDTSYKGLQDTYKALAQTMIGSNTSIVNSSTFTNATAAALTKLNPNSNYTAAAIQGTSRLDSNQLSDYFKNALTADSQDQYRNTLATRLNDLFSGSGLSSISAGMVLGGDARFEENNLKQTLINLSSDLKNLQVTTSADRTASSVAGLIDSSLNSGIISTDLASLFGSRTGSPADNITNLVSSFDSYNKSLSTQNKEAAAKAEADAQAKAAEDARIAQEQAVAAKQVQLIKRGVNPLSAFLQFSQSLRGNLGSSDSTSSNQTLGSTDTYGK